MNKTELLKKNPTELKINHRKEEEFAKNINIIISPYPGNEIIGCFEILDSNPIIIYTSSIISNDTKQEALKLRKHMKIGPQLFLKSIPANFNHKSNKFFFPHPIYEMDSECRSFSIIGEQMARNGYNVIFYIIEMNAPFKFRCKDYEKKKLLSDVVYKSQSTFYNDKNFLFSGYDKWVFNL